VSTYGEPRNPHSSSGVLRYTGVDGKPTRSSNRNTGTATSSAAEWVPQLSPFSRDASLFPLPPPSECSAPLHDYAVWTKPTLITSSNGTAMRVLSSRANKLFSLHELPSVARYMPLTSALPTRYVGVQPGGSRYGDPAAKESGSVPGTLDNQGKEARS